MIEMQWASTNLRCDVQVSSRAESPAQLQYIMLISHFTVSHNPSAASRQQQHRPDQERSREERVWQVQGPLQREGQEGGEEGPQTSEYTSALGWVYKNDNSGWRGKWRLCMWWNSVRHCGPLGFTQALFYNVKFAWCKQQILSSWCVRERVARSGPECCLQFWLHFCFISLSHSFFSLSTFIFFLNPRTTPTATVRWARKPSAAKTRMERVSRNRFHLFASQKTLSDAEAISALVCVIFFTPAVAYSSQAPQSTVRAPVRLIRPAPTTRTTANAPNPPAKTRAT